VLAARVHAAKLLQRCGGVKRLTISTFATKRFGVSAGQHRSGPACADYRYRFSATPDEPLVVGDRVAAPRATPFEGHAARPAESGRFKGRPTLAFRLDSFSLNGATYVSPLTGPTRVSRGHKKRNWVWRGRGSGGGVAIGAIASSTWAQRLLENGT